MNRQRIWDRFLDDQEKAWLLTRPDRRVGMGRRPGLMLVDLYRGGFGDVAEPLVESSKKWPWSCGLNGWRALPFIQSLLLESRRLKIPIIHITMRDPSDGLLGWNEGIHRSDEVRLVATGSDEAALRRSIKIVDELSPLGGETVIEKAAPSAFCGTPLLAHLRQLEIDTLFVAGMSTSGCVRATVVDGAAYRMRMLVVEECVFDRIEASHAISLFDIHQRYGDVISLAEATACLRSRASRGAASPGGQPPDDRAPQPGLAGVER